MSNLTTYPLGDDLLLHRMTKGEVTYWVIFHAGKLSHPVIILSDAQMQSLEMARERLESSEEF